MAFYSIPGGSVYSYSDIYFWAGTTEWKIQYRALFRLRNELYGLKENYELMLARFSKVVVHELGHTFGLIHCLHPTCIMRSSTYVEDLDQKELKFCRHCREKLDIKIKSEV